MTFWLGSGGVRLVLVYSLRASRAAQRKPILEKKKQKRNKQKEMTFCQRSSLRSFVYFQHLGQLVDIFVLPSLELLTPKGTPHCQTERELRQERAGHIKHVCQIFL